MLDDIQNLPSLLYTTPDLFIAEVINVLSAIVMYQLLANKNKTGWLYYLVSSVALIYLLWFKDSWMSVWNQSMMAVLAIKNYFLFHIPESKWHRYFDWLALAVFFFSLSLIQGLDGKSLSELLLWITIVGKTILLGKKNIGGWYLQIIQQVISIFFGLYRNIYLYVLKSVIFVIQGIYGFLKWRKPL